MPGAGPPAGRLFEAMSEPFDLPHLITEAIADVQSTADDKGVHVTGHDLAAMPQWVEGDPTAFRRMLLNTLDLVVGAATDGTVNLRLSTHDTSLDRWICVIGWRGVGDAAIEEVKAAFIVALRPSDSTGQVGPCRILVVDDSAQHRAIVTAYLAPTTHVVAEAESGEDAIARACTGAFDVVLMDIQMPGMSGLDAIRRIREQEVADGLPRAWIVALSATGSGDDASGSESAGADDCLPKPLGRDDLFRSLSAMPAREETPTEEPGSDDSRVEEVHTGGPLSPSELLALTRHQLGTILQSATGTQVERLRRLGQNLKTTSAEAGLPDITHLAVVLEAAGATGSLPDAQTAARTLQAWILRAQT